MRVPDVPDPLPDPLIHRWPAGQQIVRCHHIEMGATEFNPTSASRRFRPIADGGETVPTIYCADLPAGALSETVFHDVPVRREPRRVLRKTLTHQVMSTITPMRELRLASLHGDGLSRLRTTRRQLIESSAKHYSRTALWVQVLYDADDQLDGLVWRSRQFDDSFAVMLWGTRVSRFRDLAADPDECPLPLFLGPGLELVQESAHAKGITVVW